MFNRITTLWNYHPNMSKLARKMSHSLSMSRATNSLLKHSWCCYNIDAQTRLVYFSMTLVVYFQFLFTFAELHLPIPFLITPSSYDFSRIQRYPVVWYQYISQTHLSHMVLPNIVNLLLVAFLSLMHQYNLLTSCNED